MKKGLKEQVEKLSPAILCLQETKANEIDAERELSVLASYERYHNAALKKGYSGTSLLSKVPPLAVQKGMGIAEHDTEGRLICATYGSFYVVNVYVPNAGQALDRLDYRRQWDKDLLTYLQLLQRTKPILVCGDFNVAHRPIDLKNDKANYNRTAGYTQLEIDGMDQLLEIGLTDVFRYLYPKKEAYTYWNYRFRARERNIGWRIDYFLVSNELVPQINHMDILSDIMGSDHCPMVLEIDL